MAHTEHHAYNVQFAYAHPNGETSTAMICVWAPDKVIAYADGFVRAKAACSGFKERLVGVLSVTQDPSRKPRQMRVA